MSYKVGRLCAAALVISLLTHLQLAENVYASRSGKIAFSSTRDGNLEIYVMDGDGSNPRRLTVHPGVDEYPAWSPDGKKIAFVSNRNNVNKDLRQIWTIDADGTTPIRLTDGLVDSYPDWSPDGTKIVYDAHLHPEEHHVAPAGITVMDADGKDKRLLTGEGAHPAWSPDGRKIAFESSRSGRHSEIYVMEADGRNQKRLTYDFGDNRDPAWSPDGRHIAYTGFWNNGNLNIFNWNIHVIDSNGENQRKLTEKGLDNNSTWSPDSNTIAFESWDRDGPVSRIYTVDIGSGAVKKISEIQRQGDYQPDWFSPVGLSVSPEGSLITIWGRMKNAASRLR